VVTQSGIQIVRHFILPRDANLGSPTMTLSPKKTLLIVWHSRTGAARQMARAAQRGACAIANELQATDRFAVILKTAAQTSAEDVLAADGYLFCGPENLAALSGEM